MGLIKWKQQQQQIKLKLMDPRPYHYQYRKPRYSNPTFQSNHLYESIYQSGLYMKAQGNNQKIYNSPSYNNFTSQYKYVPENLKVSQQLPHGNQNAVNGQELQSGRVNEYAQRYVRKDETEMKGNLKNGNEYGSTDAVDRVSRSMVMDPKTQQLRYAEMQRKQSENRIYQENKQTIEKLREDAKNNYRASERANSQMRSYSQDKPSTNNSKADDDLGQISNYGTRIIRPMPGKYQDYIFQKQQKPYNIISYYPKRDQNKHRVYPKLTLQDKLLETGQMPGQNANPQFFRY